MYKQIVKIQRCWEGVGGMEKVNLFVSLNEQTNKIKLIIQLGYWMINLKRSWKIQLYETRKFSAKLCNGKGQKDRFPKLSLLMLLTATFYKIKFVIHSFWQIETLETRNSVTWWIYATIVLGKVDFICNELWIGLNGETSPQQVYMW